MCSEKIEKKLICGPEEEIVVAHGRLPSPALQIMDLQYIHIQWVSKTIDLKG